MRQLPLQDAVSFLGIKHLQRPEGHKHLNVAFIAPREVSGAHDQIGRNQSPSIVQITFRRTEHQEAFPRLSRAPLTSRGAMKATLLRLAWAAAISPPRAAADSAATGPGRSRRVPGATTHSLRHGRVSGG